MKTASRSKKLALCASAGLLFAASASYAAQYTYIPTQLKITLSNSAGQQDSLAFQQGGKLEAGVGNTNTFSGGFNTADAYGLAYAALSDSPSTTLTTTTTSEQVSSNANGYYLLNGLLSMTNVGDTLNLLSGAGGVPPYTVQDAVTASVSGSGVSIPAGNYQAGTKFAVSGPVSVTTVAGKTESDTFTGKIVLGELRGLRDSWGNLTGTRLIELHITGTLTDSAGETYKIDQVIGQNDLNGITPDQVTLNYSFTQQ